VNVLCSRARDGFILFGSMSTLSLLSRRIEAQKLGQSSLNILRRKDVSSLAFQRHVNDIELQIFSHLLRILFYCVAVEGVDDLVMRSLPVVAPL
jgi:hypothetical protein